MLPFYFGSSGRALFGVYEAPAQGAPVQGAQARGFVVCNTVGREYYFTHRAGRLLSQRLAAAGLHALRFDQLGTGDSALDSDVVEWKDWVGSVVEAVEELRDMADVASIGLIGLRAGAALAAEAAASCGVDRLVLWDPIADRARFLAELAPPEMARCFPADWASHDSSRGALPSKSLLVCSRGSAAQQGVYETMAARLAEHSPQFRFAPSTDEERWRSGEAAFGRLPDPVESMQHIVDWCREP